MRINIAREGEIISLSLSRETSFLAMPAAAARELAQKLLDLSDLVLDEQAHPATYRLVSERGFAGIRCLRCQKTSWNKNDVEQKYCGWCHWHHDVFVQASPHTTEVVSIDEILDRR